MQVSALAEALASSRRADCAISLQNLQTWLTSAGLEELARAAASLARGQNPAKDVPDDPEHAWF